MTTHKCAGCGAVFPRDAMVMQTDFPNMDKLYCKACHEKVTTEERK